MALICERLEVVTVKLSQFIAESNFLVGYLQTNTSSVDEDKSSVVGIQKSGIKPFSEKIAGFKSGTNFYIMTRHTIEKLIFTVIQ